MEQSNQEPMFFLHNKTQIQWTSWADINCMFNVTLLIPSPVLEG